MDVDIQRELTRVLHALKEEAAHAHKQSMCGEMPSVFALGRAWSNVEMVVGQLDALRRFQLKQS